ncbi:MAG TPA: hypothetical protein VM537_01490 [Anaerolineae bacterium]|nr:hypothetical protein [Anaerolineae bacterium]
MRRGLEGRLRFRGPLGGGCLLPVEPRREDEGGPGDAAEPVNHKIKPIYQVAELGHASLEVVTQGEAIKLFNILSLRVYAVYAWPDFPSSDTWMADYLSQTRLLMEKAELRMPTGFTEIGVVYHSNPGGFVGYLKTPAAVVGKSRKDAASYLIKCHVLALHVGVQGTLWHNYWDRGDRRDYAEHHAGLRDYWASRSLSMPPRSTSSTCSGGSGRPARGGWTAASTCTRSGITRRSGWWPESTPERSAR